MIVSSPNFSSSAEKPTRIRSISNASVETTSSLSSSESDAYQNRPSLINAPPQVMVINREQVYNPLSTYEVLRQTAQSYKDEIKDCYVNGCCKCCNAPITRADLNPHPQVQNCRVKCCLGCMVFIIGGGCCGGFGYTMIYKGILFQS